MSACKHNFILADCCLKEGENILRADSVTLIKMQNECIEDGHQVQWMFTICLSVHFLGCYYILYNGTFTLDFSQDSHLLLSKLK